MYIYKVFYRNKNKIKYFCERVFGLVWALLMSSQPSLAPS